MRRQVADQELSQGELEAVSAYMREVAAASVHAVPSAPASLVWRRAQLEARRERQRRRAASLASMEAVQVLVGTVGAAALAAWGWQDLVSSPTGPTSIAAVLAVVLLGAGTLLTLWDAFVRVR